MSQFVPKLREEPDSQGRTGRDGINWPSVGEWKQGESPNRLATFAVNLDVSEASVDTDILNSVPTPWARLLLFENALYDDRHPSHRDIEDQWRGLLGVIALAQPLNLNLNIGSIKLDEHNTQIAKSFTDLRPSYKTPQGDAEAGKWNNFDLISVDDVALGATSPRTLVFTGVAHNCPVSIPFRSPQGRLSDPVSYYMNFNDSDYLGLLAGWLNAFLDSLNNDRRMIAELGEIPAARGAGNTTRASLLIQRLQAWQRTLNDVQPTNIPGQQTRFTRFPYTAIRGLPQIPEVGLSDLYLRGTNDVIICYRPKPEGENGSKLVNMYGQEVQQPVKIHDGRWVEGNQPLPLPFTFLPTRLQDKVIEDPDELFEETLIRVNLPEKAEAVYNLQHGSHSYLFPFKENILNYFPPERVADYAKIIATPNHQGNVLSVELKIPVQNNHFVRVVHEYPLDDAVINNPPAVDLAMWPDFVSPAWNRHFYFKRTGTRVIEQGDFEPIGDAERRSKGNATWYATRKPVQAFVGSINGKKGLLLLRNREIDQPNRFWKVGVDFGSTHTRAFALGLDRQGNKYVTSQNATIQPIEFKTRALQLTAFDPDASRGSFLPLAGNLKPETRAELKTLMMLPDETGQALNDWLPREGFVYAHWIYDGDYDANNLRYNLKWNANRDDPELRAFLRCLLLMIQAEAVNQGAQVVDVTHTHPSVFTDALRAKHNAAWQGLSNYLNEGLVPPTPRINIQRAAMTETVAVCRYLERDEGASPVSNTISLDVGGSTTDMAVWAEKKLEVQESVKMAAGIVGRYLQSKDAKAFLEWFEELVKADPYKLEGFSLSKFKNKPAGYSLMFNNLLSVIEWKGQSGELVDQIISGHQSRGLMSHIVFLFGSLLYYAGLLARKSSLQDSQDNYDVWFCGKGGTLIDWIGAQVIAQDMFEAGLFGPTKKGSRPSPLVNVHVSSMPKEEVGRGLLAESELQGDPLGQRVGLSNISPHTVTVGETGYGALKWDDKLSAEALKELPSNTVPPMASLQELNTFLDAFKQGQSTKDAAIELGLDKVNPIDFQTKLKQRLFGAAKGSIVTDLKNKERELEALLEPLFITESKVLLEVATENSDLFKESF